MVEVAVLRDQHALLRGRELADGGVGGGVSRRKIKCVEGGVPGNAQQLAEAGRQMRIHEELHASCRWWLL